jgi:hypothetical protein
VSRDEQAGVTPLHGRGVGGDGRGGGTGPARGYSWPPFEAGNSAALTHGAYSEPRVAERAQEILTAVLEDAEMPDLLRSRAFRPTLADWARAEAMASLVFDWLCGLPVEQMASPRLAGTKAPLDLWRALSAHAGRLRARLGMDPVSYARLAKDLGLAQAASDEALRQAAARGAKLLERRLAEISAARAGDAGQSGQ